MKKKQSQTSANEVRCGDCNKELQVGDWPFCGGKGGHAPVRRKGAADFTIVVYQAADGSYRIPGRTDRKTPKGYHRVELTDRQQVAAVCREMTARDRAKFTEAQDRRAARIDAESRDARIALGRMVKNFDAYHRDLLSIARRAREHRPNYKGDFFVEALEYNHNNVER